jgi:hypothetical protein
VDHRQATYLNDEWARASQIAISGIGSHGVFVHLYINGLYWGLYNLVERPDANFAASYLGGDPDRWFTANHGGGDGGVIDRFTVMSQLAQAGNLADPAAYTTMLEFIDPKQFSDYLIVNWYAGNTDWPENNWYVNVQNPAGRNLFFVWDAEWTWHDGAQIVLGSDGFEGAPFPNVVKLLFQALIQNPDFRLTYADRLYRHLFHGGALSDDIAQQRWQDLADGIESAIVAESARWGDARYEEPITQDDWFLANAQVLAQMEGNAGRLLAEARAAGYYPPIDPPLLSQFGGEFDQTLAVTLEAPQGTIYYTTDGSDPRTPTTGAASPAAAVYAGPIELASATTIKARVLDGETWSALAEARFTRRGQHGDLYISEIMYNPPGGDEYEFLELYNGGDLAVDLSGAYFGGILFRFPDGSTLEGGKTLVLVRDLTRFRRLFAEEEVSGLYEGRLSDKGETITLYNVRGDILATVTYDDENGWPLSADGAGDSLVLVNAGGDRQDAANWRASAAINGSPGRIEPQK